MRVHSLIDSIAEIEDEIRTLVRAVDSLGKLGGETVALNFASANGGDVFFSLPREQLTTILNRKIDNARDKLTQLEDKLSQVNAYLTSIEG